MVKQYYQPEISNFYYGYEYQFHQSTSGGLFYPDNPERNVAPSIESWVGEVFNNNPIYSRKLSDIVNLMKSKQIRVPFLTKEQIEAEGWTITLHDTKPSPYLVNWINATKGTFDLWINLAMTDKMFLGVNNNKHIIFRGQCKSVNEFRTLMTWLQIN